MIPLDAFKPYEQEVIDIYKQLHQNPEPGFEEFKTSTLVQEKLKSYGIEVTADLAITGVLGVLDTGRPGKTILLRADMDALPVIEDSGIDFPSCRHGMMHACGHDSHVSMLLGAAKYLADHKDDFCGRVKFAFQPAEEGVSAQKQEEVRKLGYGVHDGAQVMIAQGVMDGVDGCYAIHINTMAKTGQMYICETEAMAAADHFEAWIMGTGGHGSSPQNATDPVSALAIAIDAIQNMPAREFSALERMVINIGTIETPGSRFNIIPANVIITGTVRTYNEEVREKVFKLLDEKIKAAAAVYGCTGKVIRDKAYDAVINDRDMSERAARLASQLLGSENVMYSDKPDMGSEDVGYFFQKAPGVLCWLGGSHPDTKNPAMLHSPYMKLDLNALKYGVASHVNFVLDFLK